ncbi:MAG TPA: hypothetical protein VE961_20185 [Pyrinomonadaceae bacterium]|nr:hypothetical protein [Pyrinomonadaceae bacterium]
MKRLLLATCLICLFTQGAFAQSQPPKGVDYAAPLSLELEVAQSSPQENRGLALIVLSNRSTKQITDISIILAGTNIAQTLYQNLTLESGASTARTIDFPISASNLYVEVHFKWDNLEQSMARAINRPAANKPEPASSVWLPLISGALGALIALVGTLVSAWLVHSYTTQREKTQKHYEWQVMSFEKYEDAYRTFLTRWAGSPLPMVLKAEYEALQSKVVVPASLHHTYIQTAKMFSDPTLSQEEREHASEALRQAVENSLREPEYTPRS